MKKYLTIGVTLITLAIILFFAFQNRKNSESQTSETTPTPNPLPVQTLSITEAKTSSSERSFPATISTEGEATVTAEVSGTIIADAVSLGSWVGIGKILYKIDERGGSIHPETGFESTALLQAKLALKNAEESYNQAKRDYAKNESQAMKTARDIQKNLRDIALSNYNALLDKYTIKSPLSGIVTMKSSTLGESVTPGTVLATIGVGKKIARFYVPTNDLSLFSAGQSVSLLANNASIPGAISHISPVADSMSKRFLIEVTSTDKTFQTLPSETIVTLTITLTRAVQKNTALIPLSALSQEQNGSFVFVVNDNRAKRQEIHIEAIYGETVEISGDFDANTQFIVTNAKRLSDGSAITLEK